MSRTLLFTSLLLAAAVDVHADSRQPARAPAPAPYGHRDFYPSSDRPVGFRGDGNGHFPGATPVTTWQEGTAVQGEMTFKDHWGNVKKDKGWDFSDDKTVNIVWKTQMPSWANSQAVVVGDRVFTVGESDLLICVDANTGKVLWTAENNVWELAGLEATAARRCHDLYQIHVAIPPMMPGMIPPASVTTTFTGKCLPRIVAALKRIDPDTAWDAPAETTRKAMEEAAKIPPDAKQDKQDRRKLQQGWTALATAVEKRMQAISGRKIPITNTWGNMVGFCMSVPVSDGRYVYASFGQGQTVCYDLAGYRVWARYIEHEAKSRTSQIQSPLLAGEILIDMHGGPGVLRGLDKKTGRLVWEAPTQGQYAFGKGGGYYVGGHKVVRLDGELYIVTSLCNIIRARDGKVVGVLPFDAGGACGGGSMACGGPAGDIVLKSSCGDNYSTPIVAYRLAAEGSDKVTARKLWQTEEKRACPGYHGQVFTGSVAILTSSVGNVVELETGARLFKPRGWRERIGGMSNILAGSTLLWLPGGSTDRLGSHWGLRRSDGKVMMQGFAADLSDPGGPKRLSGARVRGGLNPPRVPEMERYAPELYALDDYWGNWCCYGKPGHFVHVDTAWMPSGNRLFLRTLGHLYCIGDPSVPYDWNPASRPGDIRKMLE